MSERHEVGELIGRAVELAASYAANPNVNLTAEDLQNLVRETFATLSGLALTGSRDTNGTPLRRSPAEAKRSVTPDALVSFEDGRPYKTLKRHLASRGLTPMAYRQKHGLPPDYPMVAPNYSATRSRLAKDAGSRKRDNTAAVGSNPTQAAE
jgi:predicted transcriptional regulator